MYSYSDSNSDSFSISGHLSSEKETRHGATGELQDKQTQDHLTRLSAPSSSTPSRRLSPLMVDTNFEPNTRPITGVNTMTGSDPGMNHFSPYKLAEYPPPTSPGIFVPLQDYDERKIQQLSNVIAQFLSKEDPAPRDVQPFPLMDPPPPKTRMKRQISTDSTDSGDIKSSSKSPTKRLQGAQQTIVRDTHKTETEGPKTAPVLEDSASKRYANNVQWMLDDPNPSSEEDFIPVPKAHNDMENKQKEEREQRFPNTYLMRENPQRKQELMGGLRQRGSDVTVPKATQQSKMNICVTEQGFVFPERSNITDPIPFSPRVVGERPRFSKMSQMTELDQNLERHSSMSNLSNGNTPSRSSSSVHSNGKQEGMLFQLVRRKALRSNSDIDKSPSKAEIEEIKELVRKLHRSISDPTTFSPEKKALLREERMVNEYRCKDEVFEDSYPESLEQKYKPYPSMDQETNPNKELRLMNMLMREKYEALRQNAKRQLFHGGAEQLDEEYRTMNQMRKESEDMTSKLLEEFEKLSSERSLHHQLELEEARNRFSERHVPVGQLSHLRRDHRSSPDKTYYASHSPRPSTSLAQSPRQSISAIPQSPPWSQEGTRKRKRGDIEMHVSCEDLAEKTGQLTDALRHLEHVPSKNCKCANVESEILQMAIDAYSKIRRTDDTRKSFEQFQEEIKETNSTIFDAMKILGTIKSICKHGRTIEDIFPGSVVFRINCPTVNALDDIWLRYKSGDLEDMFNKNFLSVSLMERCQVVDIRLTVTIPQREYNRARRELDGAESVVTLDSSFSKSDTEIVSIGSSSKENKAAQYKSHSLNNLAIIHMHSHSDPIQSVQPPQLCSSWLLSPRSPVHTERKYSFPRPSAEHSPRRAMQELNIGKDVPCSPTLKKVFDFDIALSAKTSPKRKTFAESPPWEHENIHPGEMASPKRKNFGTTSLFWSDNVTNIKNKQT